MIGVSIMRISEFPAPQQSSFSTGFIRFFDMAGRHVIHSEKPNAFLIILEVFLRFWLRKSSFSTGSIRVSDMAGCHVV